MEFTQKNKNKIIKELNERIKRLNPDFKCPICWNTSFNVVDGFTRKHLNQKINIINLGGPNIPSISVVCSHCGYIADFAIGVLGFLHNDDEKEEEKENNGTKD